MTDGEAAGTADLEKLAAEIDGEGYLARVLAPAGRRPYLYVRNRAAAALTENIYAGDGFYWWGWAERIAPTGDVGMAAQIITRVLRTVGAR